MLDVGRLQGMQTDDHDYVDRTDDGVKASSGRPDPSPAGAKA
jgi:hypothetical protein